MQAAFDPDFGLQHITFPCERARHLLAVDWVSGFHFAVMAHGIVVIIEERQPAAFAKLQIGVPLAGIHLVSAWLLIDPESVLLSITPCRFTSPF